MSTEERKQLGTFYQNLWILRRFGRDVIGGSHRQSCMPSLLNAVWNMDRGSGPSWRWSAAPTKCSVLWKGLRSGVRRIIDCIPHWSTEHYKAWPRSERAGPKDWNCRLPSTRSSAEKLYQNVATPMPG